jgi:hypothetical protein
VSWSLPAFRGFIIFTLSPSAGGQCGSSWLWENPPAGSLPPTRPGALGPLQTVGFHNDEDGGDDADAQPQTAIRLAGLNNPAVPPALVPVPTLDFWHVQILRQAQVERERIRELVEAQQSAAPSSQLPGWLPDGIRFRPPFHLPMPTPFWTIPPPPAGGTAQTAIDLTGNDERGTELRGRRRSR